MTPRARRSSAHGFNVVSASALFAPLPPPDYLVDGALRRASLVLLGAYGSSGKTWMACDLAIAVGSGGMWLGRFECNRGRVVILDAESGEYELRRRLQAVARARGVSGDALNVEVCVFPDVYLTSPGFEERLAALATECDLIVIDSLAAMSPGVDENSAEMRVGLDKLRRVAERTGCVFFLLVHAKKANGEPDKIDLREILRGSSAIFDAADAAFAVVKRSHALQVRQVKARHGREVGSFNVSIVDQHGGVAVVGSDPTPPSPVDPGEQLRRAILDSVREQPGRSARSIEGSVKGQGKRVYEQLAQLVREGKLANVGTAHEGSYELSE